MITRHRAREVALQILYRYDMSLSSDGVQPPTGHALLTDLSHHFDHFKVPPELREFSAQLVAGTLAQLARLDELIEKHASNWRVSRMALVDRNLLRMATYEMQNFPETSPSIVIDEAIELAKQFGTTDTPAFANGILDAIKKESPASTPSQTS